jgi:hypothetical protein
MLSPQAWHDDIHAALPRTSSVACASASAERSRAAEAARRSKAVSRRSPSGYRRRARKAKKSRRNAAAKARAEEKNEASAKLTCVPGAVQHEQRNSGCALTARDECAAHDARQTRDRTKLRARGSGDCGGPGSATHRFARRTFGVCLSSCVCARAAPRPGHAGKDLSRPAELEFFAAQILSKCREGLRHDAFRIEPRLSVHRCR